jgi:hypothetical protein
MRIITNAPKYGKYDLSYNFVREAFDLFGTQGWLERTRFWVLRKELVIVGYEQLPSCRCQELQFNLDNQRISWAS